MVEELVNNRNKLEEKWNKLTPEEQFEEVKKYNNDFFTFLESEQNKFIKSLKNTITLLILDKKTSRMEKLKVSNKAFETFDESMTYFNEQVKKMI